MKLESLINKLENLSRTLTRAAFLVGFFTLLSSLLGMFRDRMLADAFGAGQELDTYYASFRIPDFFYNTLMASLISSAFLPILSQYLHKPEEKNKAKNDFDFSQDTQNFVDSLVTILTFFLFAVIVLLWFFSPFLVSWIAPGFSPEQQALTARLTRIMLLSPLFLSFSGLLGNILNLRGFFFFYSLAPVVYNLGSILAIIFLVPHFGITGLAWGIALGAFFHFSVQLVPSILMGLKIRFRWDPTHPGLIKVLKMMLPRSLHLGVLQLNLIAVTLLASVLPVGSLSVFNFANNLQSLPLGIFGASYAIAAFPALSILVAKKKKARFRHEFSRAMCQILFFIIPLSTLLIIFRAQVVRIVLGSGKFDWEDTVQTLNVLGVLAISLFAQSLNLLFIRAFFALHDAWTPLKSGVVSLLFNIVAGVGVVRYWPEIAPFLEKNAHLSGLKSPIVGLALIYSISQIITFIFLLAGLHQYIKGIDISSIKRTFLKIALATFIAGLGAQLIKWFWAIFFPLSSFLAVFGQVFFAGLVSIAFYLFICKTLKCKELKIIYDELPNFLKIKKNKA